MSTLTPEQAQALEVIRQRLSALSGNLNGLRNRIATQQDPSLAAINATTASVAENLKDLSEEVSKHQDLLSRTIVFPAGKFPVFTAPAVAENLLSTHLSLPVQEWIEGGQKSAEEATANGLLSEIDCQKLWNAARGIAVKDAKKQRWAADYTLAEVQGGVENVRTGLKRELVVPEEDDEDDMEEDEDDDEDDDDEDDAEAMDVDATTTARATTKVAAQTVAPPMDLLDILYFASMGKDIDEATKKRIKG